MLLTTHSMEEAEALGDSIGVLVRGQLRALGPGLALKRAFSSRYEVRVLTGGEEGREGRGAQVAELLRREMPCAKVEVARGDTEYLRARTKFNAGGGVHESSSWAEDGAVAPGRQMPQLSTVGFVVQVP